MNIHEKISKLSLILGNWIIVGVFLYFGIHGMTQPETFTNLIPDFIASILDARTLVIIHGALETICALLILFKLGSKWPLYILALSFIGVIASVSGLILVRDIGIFGALLLMIGNHKVINN